MPYFTLATAAALFWALKTTKLKWGVIVLALPSIIIPLLVPDLSLYRGGDEYVQDAGPTKSFTFITFSKMSHNENYNEIAKIIDCNKYDVIQVQEIRDVEAFLEAEPAVNKYCNVVVNSKNPQLVTFSKFPIAEAEHKRIPYTRLSIDNIDIALANIHAIKAIRRSADSQTSMVTRFTALSNEVSMPMIVAGDFNATPFNESIMLMRKSFKQARLNSSIMARRSTWPGEARRLGSFGPWLQIDYIFYNRLKSTNTFIHSSSYGSDHYPMQTTFTISAKG